MGSLRVQATQRRHAGLEHDTKSAILTHFAGRADVLIFETPVGFDELRRIRYGVTGMADLHACIGGRFVAIEVKSPTGRQRAEQVAYEAAVKRCGGIYILARSVADVAHL